MRLSDTALGALSSILGASVIAYSATFPSVPGQAYGPGLFPTLVGLGMLIAGLSLVAVGIRRRDVPLISPLSWMRSKDAILNAVVLVVGTLFYVLVVDELGFIPTAFALLAVALIRLHGRPVLSLVIAALAAPTIHYAFADLLLVPLPWGILQPIAW